MWPLQFKSISIQYGHGVACGVDIVDIVDIVDLEIHADKMKMLGKDYEAENKCEDMVFECARESLTIAPFSMLLKFCFYIIVGQNKIIYIWFFSSKFVLTLK